MTKKMNTIVAVMLILSTLFICIGYAALTDTLTISGTANAEGKPYSGVYIKAVEVVRTSQAGYYENSYVLPTNHVTGVDSVASGGSVTYKITVHNNTDVVYWYIGQRYVAEHGQNSLIGQNGGITIRTADKLSDTSQTFNNEDWIPPQTERDFYVTYTYGRNAQQACTTTVNFYFDIKMDAVHDEFLAVLNNHKSTNSYEYLTSVFNSNYANTRDLSITTESHPEVFQNLFESLWVNIDGTDKEAHVVIRRENLDNKSTGDSYSPGPSGCEYTLYITVESLTPGTNPTVYAISYSQGANGMGDDWYQVGELYEGTAPIKADGTIDYASWIATPKTYEMADGISYKVAAPNGDQYDIMKRMEQLIAAQDQDIFNDIDNTRIFKRVYDIIQQHRYSTDPAVVGLRKAFTDASIFYTNLNNGQEFKVNRNYTRAEIIRAIKDIQSALDYFYQAYPN